MKIADLPFGPKVPAKAAIGTSENPVAAADATFEGMFQAVVATHGDTVALVGSDAQLRFRELDSLSASIAGFIISLGYGAEDAVGVLCTRGARYLAAAMGILRAGAVYLPVEKELPLPRQEVMLSPARLIITDTHCLRRAEYLRYRLPGVTHILCLDAADGDAYIEKGGTLASTAYWEHVSEAGSDRGWLAFLGEDTPPAAVLQGLAHNVLAKTALAGLQQRRVLDIGSGSGAVAQALVGNATEYTAVELARPELDRVGRWQAPGTVLLHQMEAVDICFLEGREFDVICLHGVVECFPGYNYVRTVLRHAVDLLAEGGHIFVGAVPDLETKDAHRESLRAHAVATGDNAALLRFDASEELLVPRRFFTEWAAQSPVPVDVEFSETVVPGAPLAGCRYDVIIRRAERKHTSVCPAWQGTDALPAASQVALPPCRPEQAAYIVYTSGSTGVPKGVVVEHRHLVHIINALRPLAAGCARVALVAPLSFDASIQQLAVSLFCGGALHVLPDEERKNPSAFCRYVEQHNIDLCDMTPAFFNVLVAYLADRRLPLPVKRLLLAGEVMRPDVVHRFYSIPGNGSIVLFNVYGPTECTVDTTAFRIDVTNHEAFTAYPVGNALAGCRVTVRDAQGRRLPDAETGELWISGAGVSRGYLGDASPGAFTVAEGERCYRTGDNGYMLNGLVYYVGRDDQQVKIRGNRVEIGEVEGAIAGFPGVQQVVVVADTFRTGEDKRLAAYVVGNVDMAVLQRYLEQVLPPYCVPGYYVPMVELPFSINRKIDKRALPLPHQQVESVPLRRPTGPVEEKLADIWKRLLGVDVTDAEASFFSLGGHSILAIRLIAMIESEMQMHVSVKELFAHPSIASLSGFFAGKSCTSEGPVIKLCHCEGGKELFLFHPVGGSVFCYSELASHLSHKYSVYAVEASGFSKEKTALNTELHRVRDLAAYYLGEIMKVCGDNIILGGWSFGGLLAYEAACHYERMGHKAGAVLILDSVADNTKAKVVAAKDDVAMLKSLMQDTLAFDEAVLRSLPREEKLAYLVSCGEKTGVLPVGFSSVQMDNLLQTYRSNAIAAARYANPTPSDAHILLVRALDHAGNALTVPNDKYQGWSRFLKEENITLVWTEGTHENMLSPGLAGNVATHILDYMERE